MKTRKVKIGKVMSKRITASVLAGVLGKEKVVVKIEHVSKKDRDDKTSAGWKEIQFSEKFGNKHPKHFMQLKNYYFEAGCPGIQLDGLIQNPPSSWGKQLVAEYRALLAEDVCVYKTYDRMDCILFDILPKMSIPQVYSCLLQVSYAIKMMHKNGYIHGDLHAGNVGAMKTAKNARISLGPVSIPTHGYHFKLIDFGLTLHKSSAKTKEDKDRFEDEFGQRDDGLFPSLCDEYDGPAGYDKVMSVLKKLDEFKVVQLITSNPTMQSSLFKTMYPDTYLRLFKETQIQKAKLPLEDLIFLAHNGMHSDESFHYLLEKLK